MVGAANDRLWHRFCEGLGREDWKEEPRYKLNSDRVKHRDELEGLIEEVTKTRSTAEWLEAFEGKKLPIAPVNDVQATLNHPQSQARDMVVEMEHDACGPIKLVGTPVKYSESQPRIRTPPPLLGQHTNEVMAEFLGMEEDEVEALKGQGVLR